MIEISQLYERFLSCKGIATDTREITPGIMFVALKGPNFDANNFAGEALEKGAKYAVVDDPALSGNKGCLMVPDGLAALQHLAQYHRSKLDIPVIAITGSNGKTTTKELIHGVLSTQYRTLATAGNLNNHIGVPLTLLAIGRKVQLAIVEMGANHLGEIERLCQIARPTHGLITNIGMAHVEGFGSYEGVIRGKSELYQYLIAQQGVIFVNSRDRVLSNMAKRMTNPYYYPAPGDYLEASLSKADPYVCFCSEGGPLVETKLIGEYNFNNIAASLCVGKFFKVAARDAQQAVAAYVPQNNRSQIMTKATNTLILDAYNANPSSMEAAIGNLQSMEALAKVVILGDMYELGSESEGAHRKLGEITGTGFDKVIFCGKRMKAAHDVNPQSLYFENKADLALFLGQNPIKNSTILIKASRSMGLEQLVDYL